VPVRAALVWLAERWGVRTSARSVELRLALTNRALADLTGASREKITLALGSLRRQGLVETRPSGLLLTDVERLMGEGE
jgi:CRP-like cAMP-binding protein